MALKFIRKLFIPALFLGVILSIIILTTILIEWDSIPKNCTNTILFEWDPVSDPNASYKIFVKSSNRIFLLGETKDTQYKINSCDDYVSIGISAFYPSENETSEITWLSTKLDPIGFSVYLITNKTVHKEKENPNRRKEFISSVYY